jgi:HB1, ASXL, restriction endonuclease HTH domain
MQGYEKQTVSMQSHHHDHVEGEQQTYLRVAEIVLSKSLAPLSAREIVERGIEQGLFGDHAMGQTPQKSMQARLSMDTLLAKARFQILNNARLASDRVVVVAGRIGSGKSETAGYLSQQLQCPLIKTGELIKDLMCSPAITEIGREEFQARAYSFISAPDGTQRLATAIERQIAANEGQRVIVDGIRNLDTYERLEKSCPDGVGLLFVQTPPDVAFDMYRAREAQGTLTFSYREFLKVYDAPVEAEIPSLGRRASAYIYNSFGMEAFRRTLDEIVPKLTS